MVYKRTNYVIWASYDFANTIFSTGIMTVMSLSWFLIIGQQAGLTFSRSNGLYSSILVVSGLLMAVFLPFLGTVSDLRQKRKSWVLVLTALCIGSTTLMIINLNLIISLIGFGLSIIFFQWAILFYEAMLPAVVPPSKEAKYSAIAVALGYMGGVIPLLYPLVTYPEGDNDPISVGSELSLGYLPELGWLVVISFSLLTIPLLFLQEVDWNKVGKDSSKKVYQIRKRFGIPLKGELRKLTRITVAEVKFTFMEIRTENRGMLHYIISYFIIADIANMFTVINTGFLRVLGFSENEVIGVLIVSGVGIISVTYLLGSIMDRRGAKAGYFVIALMWMIGIICLMLYNTMIDSKFIVYLAGFVMGPALTGIFVAQRQMVLELVPDETQIGRYIGITKFSGKLSSAISPLIWALSITIFLYVGYSEVNSLRFAIVILLLVMMMGFLWLMYKVPNNYQKYRSRRRKVIL